MLKISNIKQIKSTVLGFISFAFSFFYIVKVGESLTVFFGCLITGILLMFAPDKIVNVLLEFLKKKSKDI